MKIYTKTGDNGTTGLWGGLRVAKDGLRLHAYGTVDECNSVLGIARASGLDARLDEIVAHIQGQLFVVGADLATPGEAANIPRVSAEDVVALEGFIDDLEAELEPLKAFILPGGSMAAAQLHLARTVCRRAERCGLCQGVSAMPAVRLAWRANTNSRSDKRLRYTATC
jgi:cob(I)alamin adenosyltransferase